MLNGTKLSFIKNNNKENEIRIIKENSFEISILLEPNYWEYEKIPTNVSNVLLNNPDNLINLRMNCKIKVDFSFPEINDDEIMTNYDYCKNLVELIRLYWDNEYKNERFTNSKLAMIDLKLDNLNYIIENKLALILAKQLRKNMKS